MTWGLRGERHGLRGRCALALCGAIAVVLAGGAVARAAAYDIYYDSGKAEGSSGVRDIWRMNPDGTGQAEFLPGGELPSWSTSPAGALKMAYIDASGTDFTPASPHCEAGEPTGGAVYVVNQDATSPTFIDGSCGDAAISPDGTRVALANAVEGIDSVSVADPASITQVVAVPNQTACNMAENGVDDDAECGMGYRPAWNGAGTIDYLGDEDYWSLPSSGTSSDPTLVADGSSIGGYGADGMAVDPANGDLVVSAVETMSGGVGDSLYLIAPGGSTGTLIASPPAGHGYDWPAVSPDGTTVAFEDDVLSSDPAVSTIDTVPIGGGAVKDVTPTDTTAADPAFGPPAGNQTLSGTVTDAGGNAVANVTVLITGVPPTTGSSSATTNASGQFSASLPAGQYLVETAPPGQDGNTSQFYPVASTDCTPQQLFCLVELNEARNVAFSGCLVPNPDGSPLPAATPSPIPGAITAGDLEAVGCWTPRNASGGGTATIYTSTQPVRLDGVDVKPESGSTLTLDTSGPTVTSSGPAQILIDGWPVTPAITLSLNYQGSSVVSVGDQGAGTGPLATNLFGLPIALGTGNALGYGLPFTESPGQTVISGALQIPLDTRAGWNAAKGIFESDGSTVPSLGLSGQITLSNRDGTVGQVCGSLNDTSLEPFLGAVAENNPYLDGEISGLTICYTPSKGLWNGSGMFAMPTALAKFAGDIYVTGTFQKATPQDAGATQFLGYKIGSFALQFDHLDSSTYHLSDTAEVREAGYPIGDGFFLQSLGGGFSNDLKTNKVSAISGTAGISFGPEAEVRGNSGLTGTNLALLRGDLQFTLAPGGPDIGFWTYSLAGALTFARLSPAELQLAAAKIDYHANPTSPEADFTARMGGAVLGTGASLTVNGQSDVQNGFLLEGIGRVKAFGHPVTLDAVLSNYLLGVCLTNGSTPVLGFSEDLSKLDVQAKWGCDLGAFKHPAGASTSAVAHGEQVDVPAGLRATVFAVRGAGSPPSFRLTGGGRTYTIVPSAQPHGDGGAIAFSAGDVTYAGIVAPAAGRWQITAIKGGIAGVAEANPLPSARLRARVTRSGCRALVRYHLHGAGGERIVLYAELDGTHVFVGRPHAGTGTLKLPAGAAGSGTLLAYAFRGKQPVGVTQVTRFELAKPKRSCRG